MWNSLLERARQLLALPEPVLDEVRKWSRPARVAAHAIADLRKTKIELVADNALLRLQLMVADRHIKRALFTRGERIAAAVFARFTRAWRDAMLLVQPDTVLRWQRQVCLAKTRRCRDQSAFLGRPIFRSERHLALPQAEQMSRATLLQCIYSY